MLWRKGLHGVMGFLNSVNKCGTFLHAAAPRYPIPLMWRYYRYILPEVRSRLAHWRQRAERIPDPELRRQALASLTDKRFHCEGGAVYAAVHLDSRHLLIPLIVALQTISDYLDNLCDRSTSTDGRDFRRLHQSMLDAVQPEADPADYYALHPEKDDGGYLRELTEECRKSVAALPSYAKVKPHVVRLVGLYTDLQVFKHLPPGEREPALRNWWNEHRGEYPELYWQEFAAATGSTLGVFMLFSAAADEGLSDGEASRIANAYFPYLCAEHILLDYLIDQQEDRDGGDLNFCSYYAGAEHAAQRIRLIAEEAGRRTEQLVAPKFHRMVVQGLLALYLSDPKASRQPPVRKARRILMRNSPIMRLFFWANSVMVRVTH
jgi:tetraprenyl-beta-curcumene synthase